MTIEAIQALGAHDEVAPLQASAGAPTGAGASASFAEHVTEGLRTLNDQLLTSQVDLHRLAAGEGENLHEIMVRLEESRIALQLALQVRNRVLEAYQDVMRMQI